MLKTIAEFRESFEAHLARGKLESEGIPAVVIDENIPNTGLYAESFDCVKLQVPEEDVERAREILTEDHTAEIEAIEEEEFETEPEPEEVCPRCGSHSISARGYSLLSLLTPFLCASPVYLRKKGMVCKDCGAKWKNEDSAEPEEIEKNADSDMLRRREE
jgi:hypothetical protein